MIRLSVLYPASAGSKFDWNYYLGPHLALARKLMSPHGLVRIEIDRGVGGFPPGTAPPFHAVGHLFFASIADFEGAMAATGADLIADQPKYFSGEGIVQVNEVVDL